MSLNSLSKTAIRDKMAVIDKAVSLLKDRIASEQKRKSMLNAIIDAIPRGTTLDDVRRAYIESVYDRCDQNKTRSAEWLRISLRTLRTYFNGGKK